MSTRLKVIVMYYICKPLLQWRIQFCFIAMTHHHSWNLIKALSQRFCSYQCDEADLKKSEIMERPRWFRLNETAHQPLSFFSSSLTSVKPCLTTERWEKKKNMLSSFNQFSTPILGLTDQMSMTARICVKAQFDELIQEVSPDKIKCHSCHKWKADRLILIVSFHYREVV